MTDRFSPWPVSLAEAARETGFTTKALRAMIQSGDLPYIILPGRTRRRVLLQDIADLVARGRVYHEAPTKGRRHVRNSPGSTKVYDFLARRERELAAKRAKKDPTA